jgi:signal transduction histidine kinase
MFRKTRNRILLLNMVMVSSVVIFAFIVIFTTTYTQVRNEITDRLSFARPPRNFNISGAAFRPGGVVYPESGFYNTEINGVYRRVPPDAGLSFSIFVDSQNEIIEIDSMVDMEYDTYAMMAAHALEAVDSTKAISADGRMWQYMVTPVSVISREIHEATSTIFIISNELNHIRFLDVTDSYRTISSMAIMLSGLTIVILAMFFFISRYFANRAIKPMKEAWEKQNRFITDASHELKTPLSVINANCGVLYADKDETVGSQLKWVDSIMRATDRMTGFVSSMLSLLSLEDTQIRLQRYPFDLSGALSDAAGEIEAPSVEKKLTVYREIDPDVMVESDSEHVNKILSILLDNAVKYTDCGGEITVSLVKGNRSIICTVRNSGEGIPAEELTHLFDRFYRGDPARSSENSGYGLGLSIAKAIANQLGAELTVDSVSGMFTEFKLTFTTSQ